MPRRRRPGPAVGVRFTWPGAERWKRRDAAIRPAKHAETAGMDLSAADRAEVVRRLGAVSRGS